MYKANGDKYDAHIASIAGDEVTVHWSDGDPKHRHVSNRDVFKNGVSCQSLAGTRRTIGIRAYVFRQYVFVSSVNEQCEHCKCCYDDHHQLLLLL